MKKTITLVMLLLLCLFVLSGCGCQHEWTEASCLTPKTCTKCEEVEGEALGHDWQAATCAAPETCSRCGETQGETLPHTYGDWVMGETEMTHTCTACGAAESTEIDREIYLQQALAGHWDFYVMQTASQTVTTYQLADNVVGVYFQASEDGTAKLYDSETLFDVTWEFLEYAEEEGIGLYYFSVKFDDGSTGLMMLKDIPEEPVLFFIGSDYQFVMTKNDLLASALEGTWASTDGGALHTLTLSPDRTFSGNLDGEISGTWHLKPAAAQSYGYYHAELQLACTVDGEARVESISLSLGSTDQSLEEVLRYVSFGMRLDDEYCNFTSVAEENLTELEASLTEGPKKILGQWSSTDIQVYDYNTGSSENHAATDYTITFSEDGSFTADLDETVTGTWAFDGARADYGVSYDYRITFDGQSDSSGYAYLSSQGDLSFSISDQASSTSYNFRQMDDAAKAALESANAEGEKLLVGEWTSKILNSYYQDSTEESKVMTNYTINVCEDGTFTARLDREYTGTWEFGMAEVNTQYNRTTYSYNLTIDGIDEVVHATIDDEGELSLYSYTDNVSKNISFGHLTPEDIASLKKGPELPIGTWTVTSATRYNEETQEDEPYNTSGSITISADGTFTADLNTKSTGTWQFYNYNSQEGYSYSFQFDGNDYGSIYRIEADGTMAVHEEVNGSYIYYVLNQN